jgi:DNA-directed RNA polymerase specialized sigma subunit
MSLQSDKDLVLWKRYKAGDNAALSPLMKRFNGPVARWTSKNSTPNLPKVAVEMEAWKNVKKAIDTYDPNKGAKLLTHASWHMMKGSRFVGRHADVGTLTEEQRLMVGRFKRAVEDLESKMGRPPSLMELEEYFRSDFTLNASQKLKFNRRNVARLMKELRRDVTATELSEEYGRDEQDPTDALALHTIYSDLAPRDQKIFEHATGYMGMQVLKNVEIARMVGVSPTTIGKRKKRFAGLLERALA